MKGDSPALCSRAEPGPCVCDAQGSESQGMRHTSICKSVRFRLAYNRSWLSLRESCRRRRLRGSAACYPLRPRCARPPLPKGEARSRLLLGFPFSLFLPHFFFVRSLLPPLFQYILFPLAFVFLLEEHGLLQRGRTALCRKLSANADRFKRIYPSAEPQFNKIAANYFCPAGDMPQLRLLPPQICSQLLQSYAF